MKSIILVFALIFFHGQFILHGYIDNFYILMAFHFFWNFSLVVVLHKVFDLHKLNNYIKETIRSVRSAHWGNLKDNVKKIAVCLMVSIIMVLIVFIYDMIIKNTFA